MIGENLKETYEKYLLDIQKHEPLKKNRFLVEFPDDFEIKPYHVSKIKKNEFHLGKNGMQEPCYPKLVLEFRNMEYGDYETLKIWENFNKREYPYIKIHYLAPDMCAKSTEIYTKPQVSFIQFEEDDYRVDGIKKYTLVMQYETISNNESNN